MRTTTPARETLHRLLDANLLLHPEYRDQLTSHLPMALQALCSLGADGERMNAFYEHYARRLSSAPQTAQPVQAWQSLKGRADAYPVLLASMRALVEREGVDRTLRQVVVELLPGVSAAAFHGIIRTAHAVESGHAGELAAALAYWAWRYQPLAAPRDASALSFAAWSEALIGDAPGEPLPGSLISTRMDAATSTETYQRLAGALSPFAHREAAIAALARLAVAQYVASRNFTVLHMVTGLRAVRVLLRWVRAEEDVTPILVHAFTAAYLSAGVSPSKVRASERAWPEVIAMAIASRDDHAIKLVHACREEAAVYGEGLYLRAANLAVS